VRGLEGGYRSLSHFHCELRSCRPLQDLVQLYTEDAGKLKAPKVESQRVEAGTAGPRDVGDVGSVAQTICGLPDPCLSDVLYLQSCRSGGVERWRETFNCSHSVTNIPNTSPQSDGKKFLLYIWKFRPQLPHVCKIYISTHTALHFSITPTHSTAKMASPVVDASDNSIKGEAAGPIPNDGTGMIIVGFCRALESLSDNFRRPKTRPVAWPFQSCSPAPL
jgi:hypothetical protein